MEPPRRGQLLQNLATAILVLCAVVVTGLLVRREVFSRDVGVPGRDEPTVEPDWRRYAEGGRRLGAADAPVTIVVFSDYQCRACRVLSQRLRDLRTARPADVSVVYRHHPLAGHPHAAPAARASECAAEQGRFEEMHAALFAGQASIGSEAWSAFASTAGVPDIPAFTRCLEDPGVAARVDSDLAAARTLRVQGTPTLLVNERRLLGAPPAQTLEALVDDALRASPSVSRSPGGSR